MIVRGVPKAVFVDLNPLPGVVGIGAFAANEQVAQCAGVHRLVVGGVRFSAVNQNGVVLKIVHCEFAVFRYAVG